MHTDFDPATHTYQIDGRVVPSVTQIIAPLIDYTGINEAILDRKSAIGTAVHLACQFDDEDDLDDGDLDPAIAGYIAGWRRFKAEKRPVMVLSEKQLYSKTRLAAGTLDRVMTIQDAIWMVDIKTTASLSPAVGVQTAGYCTLAHDALPEYRSLTFRRAAVQLRADGTYRFEEYTDPSDFVTFMALLAVYNWRKKHGT
jgi:hypothetical protein